MIVDTSALIAILGDEEDAMAYAGRLRTPRLGVFLPPLAPRLQQSLTPALNLSLPAALTIS